MVSFGSVVSEVPERWLCMLGNWKKKKDSAEIKWQNGGNSGRVWANHWGEVLYLDLNIAKENERPSDDLVDEFFCLAFDVEPRDKDWEWIDKKYYWTKTFSYYRKKGDGNA